MAESVCRAHSDYSASRYLARPRCDPAELEKHHIRGESLASHPNAAELAEITKLINQKKLKPIVSAVLPLSAAAKATEQAETHHTRGKIVLRVGDEPK